MHDYHEGLSGYHEDQVLHDGCTECEARARSRGLGIAHLDKANFTRAWERAAQWNRPGPGPDNIAKAEVPMLDAMWDIQLQLNKFGIPIGRVPRED